MPTLPHKPRQCSKAWIASQSCWSSCTLIILNANGLSGNLHKNNHHHQLCCCCPGSLAGITESADCQIKHLFRCYRYDSASDIRAGGLEVIAISLTFLCVWCWWQTACSFPNLLPHCGCKHMSQTGFALICSGFANQVSFESVLTAGMKARMGVTGAGTCSPLLQINNASALPAWPGTAVAQLSLLLHVKTAPYTCWTPVCVGLPGT